MPDYVLMPRPNSIIHCLDSLFKRQCLCFLFTLTNEVYIYLSLGSCHSRHWILCQCAQWTLLPLYRLGLAPIKITTWFSSALNLVSLRVSSAYVWYIASLQVTCLHVRSKQGLTPPCSSRFISKNINMAILSHGKLNTMNNE